MSSQVIAYDHSKNVHSLAGPRAALPILLEGRKPASLLDVGCGTGTWLKAAQEYGAPDVFGVDGIAVRNDDFHVSPELFRLINLEDEWSLERRFDVALCLEVAEHLSEAAGPVLVRALVAHADTIFFSAACPGQEGDHHVNCQWPVFWQALFNREGYCCDDAARWRIWGDERIEPWYRQNLMVATRNRAAAGKEPRILSVVNPAMFGGDLRGRRDSKEEILRQLGEGSQELGWYLGLPFRAILAKLRRRLQG